MKAEKTGRHYDQIADRWNSESFPRTNAIRQHARALAFLEKKLHALDIGCGCSGRIIDLLISQGFSVEGIDVSRRMIELAKERHPQISFNLADFCTWEPPKKYDFISAWDSTWHVALADQETVLNKMLQSLTPGGVCIFTTGGMDEASEKTDSFMGPQMYYALLGISRTLEVIAESGCVCRHLEYDQYPEKHLCIIAQRTE